MTQPIVSGSNAKVTQLFFGWIRFHIDFNSLPIPAFRKVDCSAFANNLASFLFSKPATIRPIALRPNLSAGLASSRVWKFCEKFVRELAPGIEYQKWDGVSHFLMMDEPQKFNDALAAFLVANKLMKK